MPQEIADLRVGDTLWSFDTNRRKYAGTGARSGPPIYKDHYLEETIIGETPRSWLVGPQKTKVAKKDLSCRTEYGFGGYFTRSVMEDRIWVHENRMAIVQEITYTMDADLLRAVRALINAA
jgi:hypothetical protein